MNQDIIKLFHKYLNSQCSSEELDKVLAILEAGTFLEEWDVALLQDAALQMDAADELPLQNELSKMKLHHRLMTAVNQGDKSIRLESSSLIWKRISIAAAVSAIVFGLWFFTVPHPGSPAGRAQQSELSDIAPGTRGATITLANGQVIQLDSTKKGVLIGTALTYDDGAILSSAARVPELISGGQLTASTAKGQTYEFTLPDGTQVYLNSDSKLSFQADMHKRLTRKVTLLGEGYFKVAKDKSHPFIVESNGQQVKVLGTVFNINSYADEPDRKTTLIEGSIEISSSKNKSLLQPGQQAIVNDSGALAVAEADTEMATAWKNDKFIFEDNDIQSVMRVLKRWYNIEVAYSGPLPELSFGGKISRSNNLSSVLRFLETTGGVHFKLEGHKVYVHK
ncbi:FecR family protein [Pedobacter sp. GR22-6]|uniref:FecR family protein n=1 Tax=Pedobacter sp. GR22-6 TaxID=3127957 RepID=UPI00307E714E